jgi:RNA polymerase sigma-70 factor (ECF subfamily)
MKPIMDKRDRVDEFIRLFTEFEPRVHAYVLSLAPDWAEAEEILQETNAVLWAKFDEFAPGSSFFAWACQIVRFKVLEFQRERGLRGLRGRGRGRRVMQLDPAVLEQIEADTVEMADELADRQRALSSCLAKLPPRDRELIQRRYMDNATPQSVAEQLGRTTEAVYKALQRIRRALADCITRTLRAEGRA